MKRVAKQTRVEFAKEYILEHPMTGHRKINLAIRKEYGTGLRISEVSRLRDSTLLSKPSKPTGRKSIQGIIDIGAIPAEAVKGKEWTEVVRIEEMYHRLKSSGFIQSEVITLLNPSGGDKALGSDAYIKMMVTRRSKVRQARKAGLTNEQIVASITYWRQQFANIKGGRLAEFDFLREAYDYDGRKPLPHKTDVKTAIHKAYNVDKARKAREVTDTLYNQWGKPIYNNYGLGSHKRLK